MNYTVRYPSVPCITFLSYHHNLPNTDVTLFREVRTRLSFIYRRRLVMVILKLDRNGRPTVPATRSPDTSLTAQSARIMEVCLPAHADHMLIMCDIMGSLELAIRYIMIRRGASVLSRILPFSIFGQLGCHCP